MSDLERFWVIGDPAGVGWFAQSLRAAMEEHGVSVMALSRRMETSPSLVRKWRAGSSVPSVERAAEIAAAVGADPAVMCVPTSRPAGAVDRRRDPLDLLEEDADREGLPPATGGRGHGGAARALA